MKILTNYLILVLISTIISFVSPIYAQSIDLPKLSQFGRFEADYVKGCAPLTIHITELDSFGPISRTYTYESGATQTADTFYTYNSPGRYEIVQLLGEDIIPKTDTLVIQVYESAEPKHSWAYCDANNIKVFFPDSTYDGYWWINQNDTTEFNSNSGWENMIETDPNSIIQVQGYYNQARSNCQVINQSVTPSPINYDLIIDSISFVYLCDNQVMMSILQEPNLHQVYQVKLVENQTSITEIFSGFLNQDMFKSDTIQLNPASNDICIEITPISACDGFTGDSERFCFDYQSISQPVQSAFATFQGDSIYLYFDDQTVGNYQLTKYADGQDAGIVSNVSSPFIDNNISPLRTYRYELVFFPDCPVDSYTFGISPPQIKLTPLKDNTYEINYQYPEYFTPNQSDIKSTFIENIGSTIIREKGTPTIYRLSSEQGSYQNIQWVGIWDGLDLRSNIVRLGYKPIIYVPDAFTPNDDGINDHLELYGLGDNPFTLLIFNKWGEKIFETNDKTQFWDGRLSNGHIVEDVFYYKLNFSNSDGEFFNQEGSFVVIRD